MNLESLKHARRLYVDRLNFLRSEIENLDDDIREKTIEEPIEHYLTGTIAALENGGDGYILTEGRNTKKDSKEVTFKRGLKAEIENNSLVLEREHYNTDFEKRKIEKLDDSPDIDSYLELISDPGLKLDGKRALILKGKTILSMYRSRYLIRELMKVNEGREEKPFGFDFLSCVKPRQFELWKEEIENFTQSLKERS